MTSSRIWLLVTGLIMMLACQEEEETLPLPTFPFTYKAINQGSETISRINLHTFTGYPQEDSGYWAGTAKNIWKDYDSDGYLKPYDSVTLQADPLVYPGCVVSMTVGVASLVNNGGYEQERFVFYSKVDTVRSVADSVMRVVWPRDSVLFTEN